MKRPFLALCLLLCPAAARAGLVVYDNGASNSLNTDIRPNDVLVRDSAAPGSSPTTLNILYPGAVNNATVQDHSSLNLYAGGIFRAENVYAYGFSTVNTIFDSGFGAFGYLYLHDSSTAVVTTGQTFGVSTDGSSTLHWFGGETGNGDTFAGNSTVVIDSIQVHNSGLHGVPGIITRDYANVTLHNVAGPGTSLTTDFGGHSTVSIDGGYEWSMTVHDSARVSWGGSRAAAATDPRFTRTVSVSDSGTLTIYGGNFNYAYGELPVDTGTLSGTLADGTAFQVKFSGGQHIYLVAAPAPSGVVLAVAGLFCLAGYAWPRRPALG